MSSWYKPWRMSFWHSLWHGLTPIGKAAYLLIRPDAEIISVVVPGETP